jgi:hypothetical protein
MRSAMGATLGSGRRLLARLGTGNALAGGCGNLTIGGQL